VPLLGKIWYLEKSKTVVEKLGRKQTVRVKSHDFCCRKICIFHFSAVINVNIFLLTSVSTTKGLGGPIPCVLSISFRLRNDLYCVSWGVTLLTAHLPQR